MWAHVGICTCVWVHRHVEARSKCLYLPQSFPTLFFWPRVSQCIKSPWIDKTGWTESSEHSLLHPLTLSLQHTHISSFNMDSRNCTPPLMLTQWTLYTLSHLSNLRICFFFKKISLINKNYFSESLQICKLNYIACLAYKSLNALLEITSFSKFLVIYLTV